MQNENRGYTIPELIIVAVVLGLFSVITINKASYAFEDTNEVSEQTVEMILVKSATAYGESIKETLETEKTKYISASDLVSAGYLIDDEEYKGIKIKIDYEEETEKISVEVIR